MARYEHEYGTLRFSQTGYLAFVRALRAQYNDYINAVYAASLNLHKELSAIAGTGKTQRQHERFRRYEDRYDDVAHPTARGVINIPDSLMAVIKAELFRGANGTLCIPRQKAFATLTNKQTTFSLPHSEGFGVHVSATAKTLRWDVARNNHAVRDAHHHAIAQVMFNTLNQHTWKRGEGGLFWHSDEYSEDAARENDSPTTASISVSYGPAGAEEQDRHYCHVNDRFRQRRRSR